MTLNERCEYFRLLFEDLQDTNSLIEKRKRIEKIPYEFKADFIYIIECLNGEHKFGYKFTVSPYWEDMNGMLYDGFFKNEEVRKVLEYLQEPIKNHKLTEINILAYCNSVAELAWFFAPIVNRELKLGIGKSLLDKKDFAPMLAKKYEGDIPYDCKGYFITEKLDGNRCIASYENDKWVFRSRNGKIMYVNFDMGDLSTDYVYDGEVMSKSQTQSSRDLYNNILDGVEEKVYDDEFSKTSGIINRHSSDKELVYNIFDVIIEGIPYEERREILEEIASYVDYSADHIRILPVLAKCTYETIDDVTAEYLEKVCNMGGEGIMINRASGAYEHKRTDQLYKLKQIQSMDMKVISLQPGSGKYITAIGALECWCKTDDGDVIRTFVGSGLSDEQRFRWAMHPDDIIGKIVEVQYFSLSQNKNNDGLDYYSLRFPRLKCVRDDKDTTSEY